MGTPEFALPSLQALADQYLIAGVVTQPDRPAGRGRASTPSPVKRLALELGLPVIQPRRLHETQAIAQLHEWQPDLIVVVAFGQILGKVVLNLPPHGCINVHASLLPRWRGAAPIQAAILAGDNKTGVTIMLMESGIDTGPILSKKETPILAEDTAGTLSSRLAQLGADLLIDTLPAYLRGELILRPQEETGIPASYVPMLKKEDGLLDFSQAAEKLARQVRAYHPWPGSYLIWQREPLKVLRARAEEGANPGEGIQTVFHGFPAIGTGLGLLVLEEVQPAGRKPMSGSAFLQGARGWSQLIHGN